MGKMKNRKSPGIKNIPNELIKYGSRDLAKDLTSFFNGVIVNHIVVQKSLKAKPETVVTSDTVTVGI